MIEVLSPSTEGDDEGEKRLDFQSLSSLRAYVLAYQDQRCVKIHRRDESGHWHAEAETYVDDQSFSLPTLKAPISVDEVYDGILDAEGRSLLR